MINDMQLQPLQPGTADYESAENLYVEAFPSVERRPVEAWRRLVGSGGTPFRAVKVVSPSVGFLGFITYWDFGNFLYVEHFSVSARARGGGVGGRALDALVRQEAPRPFVLEVEPPVSEMAQRRVRFYERHGFALSDLPYVQPCYEGNEGDGLTLNLTTTGPDFLRENADEVRRTIYREVYGVSTDGSCR